MEQKIVVGLSRGEFISSTISRETCHVCGEFTRIVVNNMYGMSYCCGNPKCGEDK